MSMALEMITSIRSIEDLPVLDEPAKAAVVAAFETLIVDQALEDAYELYDRLVSWRPPRFIASAEPDASPPNTSSPDGLRSGLEPAASSPDETHSGADSRIAKTRALTDLRRSQVPDPTDEPGESDDEEASTPSSGGSISLIAPTGSLDILAPAPLPDDSAHPESESGDSDHAF
jgi:hypothetical protein